MASENALRDANNVPSLLLENASVTGETKRAKGDQTTGRLLVDSSVGGDVVGPASSVLNDIAVFADTTGKLLKDSLVTLTASGSAVLTFPTTTDTLVGRATTDTLTNKTLTSPIIANIAPGANFTLTQNSVAALTSVNAGAIVNTVVLTTGLVGINTAAPLSRLSVNGGVAIGTYSTANAAPTNGLIVSGPVGLGVTTPTANVHLKAGTATANTAPLKFTSGTLNTSAEAGAMEFLTDAFYGTITTGAARKTFAFLESPSFTTPALGVATATSINGLTISTTTGTFTMTNAKTLAVTNTLTLSGTDSTVMTFPSTTATIARTDAAQTFTGTQTFSQVITTANAIAAAGNAATVPVTSKNNIVTNNSAATLTITLTTAAAVNMQECTVQVLDFSAVAQTIVWVNTENSTTTAPTTSNGSTSLPLTAGFKYNSATSKWRCVAST